MNCVDFVFDCYSHITSHVSQVFASITHYTSYSLLNTVHASVCVFGLTNQVWEYLEKCAQHICCLRKLNGEWLKLVFEKLGFKILGFWKIIPSHTHAFYFCNLMLWGVVFQNLVCVFQKCDFSQNLVSLWPFRSIQPVFRSIEKVLSFVLKWLCFSIDRM